MAARDRSVMQCRRDFLRHFPRGFRDETYVARERGHKVAAHEAWQAELNRAALEAMLAANDYHAIAAAAMGIEGRANLLFSFEKLALRDAVKSSVGARTFAIGIHDFLHGDEAIARRFERWVDAVSRLPRRQSRVLTWPVVTAFGMIAAPDQHIFLKPNVTRLAADAYGFDFRYASRPNWRTYESLLDFARTIDRDTPDLRPRDLIDLQSFIWVLGSDEY